MSITTKASPEDQDEADIFARRRFLMSVGPTISQRLGFFTVPLGFLPGTRDGERPSGFGSGVLVRLMDRYFVMTAGHCTKCIGAKVLIAIARHVPRAHRFEAPVRRVNSIKTGNGLDCGYVELEARDAITIESSARVFASERTIQVLAPQRLISDFEWLTFAGYPYAFYTEHPERNVTGIRLTYIHGAPSGKIGTPENPSAPLVDGINYVDLAVPQETTLAAEDDGRRIVGLPFLGGISGGGCWKPNLANEPWTPDQYKLIGTVVAGHSAGIGSKYASHFRVILIAHHLKMIADDYPELREFLRAHFDLLAFA